MAKGVGKKGLYLMMKFVQIVRKFMCFAHKGPLKVQVTIIGPLSSLQSQESAVQV